MTGEHTIVVGVDGSKASETALRWAVGEAAATGREVRAVTAWSQALESGAGLPTHTVAEMVETYRAAQDELLRSVARPGVTVRGEVIEGTAADVLLEAAQGADLLVLGTHGHGAVMRALMGSVSARCLRLAACPVVVLPVRAVDPESEHAHAVAALDYVPGPIV
ncbi:MAG TPA: universal stress protein [Mycobacteriales bacterium]|nr:universal stress protein [Mycobacteriales bacterium]